MKFRRRTVAVVGVVMLVVAACSSDSSNPIFDAGTPEEAGPLGLPTGADDQSGGGDGQGNDGDIDFGDLDSVDASSDRPLPLREGLGTLENYEWHMELTTVGPTAAEQLIVASDWSFNRDPQSNFSRTTSTQTGPDFEEPETTTQDLYAVDGETCQFDGETWTYTEATDQQREVLDVGERLFDFTIVPDNPVEVGQETIAGISATHFSYTVSGFGSESGALVTANQMDYWVANDTGVLLKYAMVVESRSGPTSDPEAEVYRVEASAELMSANVFVPIELPEGCLAEKAAADA